MHSLNSRFLILNSRVPGCALRPIPTCAGDPSGPLYLQRSQINCSCTTARYICSMKTARDLCGMYRCNIAADPDENGLRIPDKNPSRTRERMCTHTMRRRCRSDHTPQHTHIHAHTQQVHAGNVLHISLARERADSGSRVIRLSAASASRLLALVRFVHPSEGVKAADQTGMDPSTFATWTHMHTHAHTPPSVRPSVLLPFWPPVLGFHTYVRLRAHIRAFTCGTCTLHASNTSGTHRCILWSLKAYIGSTKRQRKSTVGYSPSVLTMHCVRSLCTYAPVRPSARPVYWSIQVSACSQCAKKRLRSSVPKWFKTLMARASRSSTGELNSISSGSKCHWSDSRSIMLSLELSIALLLKCTAMVTRLPLSKYRYLTHFPVGTGRNRTAILPAHRGAMSVKNVSVPGRDTSTLSFSANVTGSGSRCT